jgi:hypothetical protein
MAIALAVNSAGDCAAATYGWKAGTDVGVAIGGECSTRVFCYNRRVAL